MASASVIAQQQLTSAAEEVLKNPIEFVPAKNPEQANERPANYIKIVPDGGKENGPSPAATATGTATEGPTNSATDTATAERPSEGGGFYDVNEKEDDYGSREKSRIVKSWSPALKKAPIGLLNRGVTCYMNSAIQVIFHLPAMAQYLYDLAQGKYSDNIPRSTVSMELAHLHQRCVDEKSSRKKHVYPARLISRLFDINCMMSEWDQEDSHEYFMSLLNRLQEDSTPKGVKLNASIIHEILGGTLTQKVKCQNCNEVSTTQQDFMDLSVSFSSWENKNSRPYTVERSIKEYFMPEVIEAEKDNKESGYSCEKCKQLSSARKEWQIQDAPEYLTVHIKRFAYADKHSKKVKDAIKYPLDLDLTKFSVGNKGSQIMYRLVAVLVHEGRTVTSGHYTAYCRQPNGKWAEYDDECVRTVGLQTVLNQSSAYMLVYSRLLQKPEPPKTNPKPQHQPSSHKRQHSEDDDDAIEKIFAEKKLKKN